MDMDFILVWSRICNNLEMVNWCQCQLFFYLESNYDFCGWWSFICQYLYCFFVELVVVCCFCVFRYDYISNCDYSLYCLYCLEYL